jgi:hypothetical protein
MPVIPHGIPHFIIRPPMTTSDDGKPSESVARDVQRVFDLMEDERHLIALSLYENARERVNEWKHMKEKKGQKNHHKHLKAMFHSKSKDYDSKSKLDKEMKNAIELLDSKKEVLEKLEVRQRKNVYLLLATTFIHLTSCFPTLASLQDFSSSATQLEYRR